MVAGGFHVRPRIEPIRASMNPIRKPPTVKIAPTNVNTSTKMEPVLTLDFSELFIIAAPTIMTIPLTSPIAPTVATANPAMPNPAIPAKAPTNPATAAINPPTSR